MKIGNFFAELDKWVFPRYEGSTASAYVLLGDFERAFPLLQDAVEQPAEQGLTPALLRLGHDWDPIRNDPRFQKLLVNKP
jgi:hypothetical protein